MSKIVIGRNLLLLLLTVAGGLNSGLAAADRGGRQAQGRDAQEAAEKAQQSTGGRVLNIQGQNRPDKDGYKVRVLTPDGRVRTVDVEPRQGK